MKKNLIIGAATGYKYDAMQYFFSSLKKINFDGDIALVVSDNIDEQTKNNLLNQGVHLIFVNNKSLRFAQKYAQSRLWKVHYLPHKLIYSLLSIGDNSLGRLSRYVKMFHLVSDSRYCYYYDYLLTSKDKYKAILMTDVRDVVFQADPFADFDKDEHLKFYEQGHSIENNFYTSYWLRHAFGKKALNNIKDKPSVCSGTTMGTFNRVIVYLENMIKTMAQITGGITGLGGFDQGVHNYLIYNNYFAGSTLVKNAESEVATLDDLTSVSLNAERELVNTQQQVIPIVHLFDRHPDLKLKALD